MVCNSSSQAGLVEGQLLGWLILSEGCVGNWLEGLGTEHLLFGDLNVTVCLINKPHLLPITQHGFLKTSQKEPFWSLQTNKNHFIETWWPFWPCAKKSFYTTSMHPSRSSIIPFLALSMWAAICGYLLKSSRPLGRCGFPMREIWSPTHWKIILPFSQGWNSQGNLRK